MPFGKHKNPPIVNVHVLRASARALIETQISNRSFQDCLSNAGKGDFVYLDPPYVPPNDTSYFTRYMTNGFTMTDQKSLDALVTALDKRGAVFAASNAFLPVVRELYQEFR